MSISGTLVITWKQFQSKLHHFVCVNIWSWLNLYERVKDKHRLDTLEKEKPDGEIAFLYIKNYYEHITNE